MTFLCLRGPNSIFLAYLRQQFDTDRIEQNSFLLAGSPIPPHGSRSSDSIPSRIPKDGNTQSHWLFIRSGAKIINPRLMASPIGVEHSQLRAKEENGRCNSDFTSTGPNEIIATSTRFALSESVLALVQSLQSTIQLAIFEPAIEPDWTE
jgi:hypothetical protein